MTRKHFTDIAETVRIERNRASSDEQRDAIDSLARALCADFKRANTAFKRERFLAACGISEH